ncbi:hypothetical protein [Planktothricoides raciborskii]|uniref:Uncharacterized protein n=2 Tax=Planktothricoides raciborskii TaxID=132608 RepID=A0AAU8JBB1_9CYAN|nr:hypothetical protein [Planktothricoides raciborskii]MBD2543190.1 hypothetical protein [Planktothricoides raciborskii FACHB-1370]MBD2580895.1 hypothetical protein [Planktothricoides raciborskii FACHB-1261]
MEVLLEAIADIPNLSDRHLILIYSRNRVFGVFLRKFWVNPNKKPRFLT